MGELEKHTEFLIENFKRKWKMSMLVFWVVTSCGLVGRYQRFGGTYCFHLLSSFKRRAHMRGKYYNNLREMGCEDMNWTQMARNRIQWRAFVNKVINLAAYLAAE
jgi:hypothetical protein